MHVNMLSINDYNELNSFNIYRRSLCYFLIILILIIGMTITLNKLERRTYYENRILIIDKEKAFINISIDDFDFLKKNKTMIISKKEYHYSISDVKLVSNNNLFYEVTIKMKNDLIPNTINNYSLFKEKINILKYIFHKVKGEI